MSVGWLKVRRTDYETLEKQKIMPLALSIILGYLVCWSWHAYFKLKDHQIIGTTHGATILDRIMKNEAANPPSIAPPPPKSWVKPRKSQNTPFSHPCLEGRRYRFPIYFVQNRRQPGGILNIYYSRLRDEIPAPGNSVPRTLVKAKPRWQTSEGQRYL